MQGHFRELFFSLHKAGGFDPKAPGAFTVGDLSLAVSKLVLGAGLVSVIAVVAIKRVEPMRAAMWIFGALVLCTPVMHPWYLLWVLPLAAVLGHWPWMVLGALLPLSYLPLDRWWHEGVWHAPIWIQLVEWGCFAVLAAVFYYLKSAKKDFTLGVSSSNKI